MSSAVNDQLSNLGAAVSPYGLAPGVYRLHYRPGEPAVPAYGALTAGSAELLRADPLTGDGPAAKTLTAAGSSTVPERARLLAVAELLERYCAGMAQQSATVIRATARELGDEALDLSTLPLLSAEEFLIPGRRLSRRMWMRRSAG